LQGSTLTTHKRCSYSFLALQHMAHGSTPAPPCRACTTHLRGSSSFYMASSGRPCGQAHNAPRTRACRHASRVTVATPTSARSRRRHHAHGTVPRSRSPRTFPQDNVPVRCLALVTVHRSLLPAHARRSRPQMVSRPCHCSVFPSSHCSRLMVTFPFPPHVPPGHVPTSHSQSGPMHAMHCSDWEVRLMGAFMLPSSKPGAGLA
jgi:hypothetical protein